MAGGDAAHRNPGDPEVPVAPRQSDPGRAAGGQREILAQFEAAIAGMHTRDIQIGLRHLLGRTSATADRPPEPGPERGGPAAYPAAEEAEVLRDPGAGLAGGTVYGARPWLDLDGLPGPVAELVVAVRTPSARRQMERLISDADLQQAISVDPATAARMVRPYSWLLDRVGDDGIKLTDAGHLPPAEVMAVIGALGLAAEGTGRVSRENQAPPVVQLRKSAQATELVRRHRGRLVLTARGAGLRHDPCALWWHLAERMPLRSAAVSEAQPGLTLLACVAARFTDTLDVTIARMLTAMGWLNPDGSPLTGAEAAEATSGTHAVLRRLGVLPHDPRPGVAPWPAPEGVAFARAALQCWPRGVEPPQIPLRGLRPRS